MEALSVMHQHFESTEGDVQYICSLAICRPSGCAVASGIVGFVIVVVVGICNRS